MLPEKPRLHRSYQAILLPETDEVQVHSDGRAVRVSAIDSTLPVKRVIPLLDGTRTLEDIARCLPDVESVQIERLLGQLLDARLLEDASDSISTQSHAHDRYARQITFFSHFSLEARALQRKLSESHVLVAGLGRVGARLLRSLITSGVGRLTAMAGPLDSPARSAAVIRNVCRAAQRRSLACREGTLFEDGVCLPSAELRGVDVVIVALDAPAPGLLSQINTVCVGANTIWLPVGINGAEAYFGPTVLPGRTACYTCCDLRTKANLDHVEAYRLYEERLNAGQHRDFGTLPQFPRIIAEMATTEVVRLLSGFHRATTYGRVFTVDLVTLASCFHDVLRLPRCPTCGESSVGDQP